MVTFVLVITKLGLLPFSKGSKLEAGEVMVQDPPKEVIILRVDASKSIEKSGKV